MALDPVSLTRTLIDIPSLSGEENGYTEAVERILQDLGMEVQRQEIGDGRFNLMATQGRPRVVLCTHLDTVPPFFPFAEDADYLYGRGACDTKGILASMLVACEKLIASGVGDFGVLLVVSEETDSIGAKKANLQCGDLGTEVIIVGEPTESKFVRASKGACTAVIGFRGVAAHSAYPERGDSAIRKMMRAVVEIEGASWGSDPVLGATTVNVGVVRGGERANIIPASAEMEVIFRIAGPWKPLAERLELMVEPFDGFVVRIHGNDPTWMASPEGHDPVVVSFNTDVPHLPALGRPILFGPGSILDAHTANERIAKKDQADAAATYERLVRGLLNGELALRDGRASDAP